MNQIENKQKKMLLVLPLLVIPFATMLFWALGGGKSAQAQQQVATSKGLNMRLPGANLKNDSSQNKLSFYEQAEKDSMRFRQERKDDPYYKSNGSVQSPDSIKMHDSGGAHFFANGPHAYIGYGQQPLSNSSASLTADELQINQKLAEIRRQISQQPTQPQMSTAAANSHNDSQAAKLQAAIQQMSTASDPQMDQLNGMLDKIMAIQHPELAKEKAKAQSEKERGIVLPVATSIAADETLMRGSEDSGKGIAIYNPVASNGFYDAEHNDQQQPDNSVAAAVQQTQTLTTGATIKLRLLQDIYINGRLIPRGNFVFGMCTVEGERMNVDIKTIRSGNSVFSVSLRVYDQDGLSGIYVPGAITRDAVKEGADQAVQTYDPLTYSPSVGAQAASAGISIAKGIFSKKIKLVKVTVKAGYSVLLLNGNQLSN